MNPPSGPIAKVISLFKPDGQISVVLGCSVEGIVLQLKELGIELVDKESTLSASQRYNNLLESANHGDIEAQYHLGRIYFIGNEVTEDCHKAVYWYKKAADCNSLR